jgi:excisionase family DNA binding protein
MNQRLFSPKEIAQALGVSQASIKRWVDKGIIKAEKTSGGHRKISLSALQEYLKKSKRELINPEIVDSGISRPSTILPDFLAAEIPESTISGLINSRLLFLRYSCSADKDIFR